MRNRRLVDLNFRRLVDYGGQPKVKNRYDPPLPCKGYCVKCEKKGLLAGSGHVLDLMSHGCDSNDFRDLLGPLPVRGPALIDAPVVFLLLDPGADCGNGQEVPFGRHRKKPPVLHYCWTPQGDTWPRLQTVLRGRNFYGPYFAYLMHKHRLANVYITNVVKCRIAPKVGESRRPSWSKDEIRKLCVRTYLTEELREHDPEVIFCFGREVHGVARDLKRQLGARWRSEYLSHPAFILHRSQTIGKKPQQVVIENDGRVRKALRDAGLLRTPQ
jgi:hypothetical protein